MFDPSRMDPKTLMELTALVQQLPRDQLMRMQGLMHNMMAGFDVRKELEELERELPPGFREKLTRLMLSSGAGFPAGPEKGVEAEVVPSEVNAEVVDESDMTEREARLTILRGVANGRLSPEEAERLLFQ